MTILQIRAVAPLLVVALLSSLGCENDGSGSNTLLFNGGVGPSPTSSNLIVKRPDVSAAPPGSIAPTLGLPPTLNVPPTLGFLRLRPLSLTVVFSWDGSKRSASPPRSVLFRWRSSRRSTWSSRATEGPTCS